MVSVHRPRRRHDGVELVVFAPPHVAIRLPAQVTSELGRADVVPNNMVEDLVEPGYVLMVDYGRLTELPRLSDIKPHRRDDDDFYRRYLREGY